MVSVQENYARLAPRYRAELFFIFGTSVVIGAIVVLQIIAERSRARHKQRADRQGKHWITDTGDGRLCHHIRRISVVIMVVRSLSAIRLLYSNKPAQAIDWISTIATSFLLAGTGMMIGAELAGQAKLFASRRLTLNTTPDITIAFRLSGLSLAFMTLAFIITFWLDRFYAIVIVDIVFSIMIISIMVYLWRQGISIHYGMSASADAARRRQDSLPPKCVQVEDSDVRLMPKEHSSPKPRPRASLTKITRLAEEYSHSPIRRFLKFLAFATIAAVLAEVALCYYIVTVVQANPSKRFFQPEEPGSDVYDRFSMTSAIHFIVVLLLLWRSWGGFTWLILPNSCLTPYLQFHPSAANSPADSGSGEQASHLSQSHVSKSTDELDSLEKELLEMQQQPATPQSQTATQNILMCTAPARSPKGASDKKVNTL